MIGTVAGGLQAGLPVVPVTWYRERVAVSDHVAGGVSLDPLERSFRITDVRWRTAAAGRRP